MTTDYKTFIKQGAEIKREPIPESPIENAQPWLFIEFMELVSERLRNNPTETSQQISEWIQEMTGERDPQAYFEKVKPG